MKQITVDSSKVLKIDCWGGGGGTRYRYIPNESVYGSGGGGGGCTHMFLLRAHVHPLIACSARVSTSPEIQEFSGILGVFKDHFV